MKHPIRDMRFSQKIMLVFIPMTLVILIASGMVFYEYASEKIVENFNDSAYDMVNQIEYSLSSQLQALLQRTSSLIRNRVFETALGNYIAMPDSKNQVVALGTVADMINEVRNSEPLEHSIFVHTALGDFDDFSRNKNGSFHFDTSDFAKAFKDPLAPPLQWFPLQRDCVFTREEWVIPFVWKFSIYDLPDEVLYMVVQIDRKALKNALGGSFRSVDYAFVFDHQGNLILGEGDALSDIGKVLKNEGTDETWKQDIQLNEQEYVAMHTRVPLNGWEILVLKSKNGMYQDLTAIRNKIWGTAAVLMFLSTFALMLILHQLTKSLVELSKRMCSVRNGDWSARFIYPHQDEIGELAQSFNFMLDEMESLLEKQNQSIEDLRKEKNRVADIQKQKRKAELAALQAQINPHFLYNTLNTITWQAVASGDEKISTISHALGRFFRLSLSRGAEIISVRDEIDHVRNYLLIQQIRYGDRLSFTIDTDEALLDCPIIKLVLQPLVENALYHGIKMKEGPGHIAIRAFLEKPSVMCFEVQDDGAGIEPEKLKIMNDELRRVITRQSEGYGIFNVNERISLYYGEKYGLSYTSTLGEGTTVRFSVPVLSWEESGNDSDCDRG